MKTDQDSLPFSRNVAKRTRRAGRAYVNCSPKNGFVEVRLESRLEQSIAQALELDPRVRSYSTQPFTLDLSSGELLAEKPSRKPPGALYFTPDFTLELPHLRVVMEAKPFAFVSKNAELFDRVRACLLKHGMRFIVVSETDFPGHYLRNIDLFMQYQTQVGSHLNAWVQPLLQRSPEALRGHVNAVFRDLQPANHHLAAAVLLGVIQFDLACHQFERMDFVVEPAFGSLSAFEVIQYE